MTFGACLDENKKVEEKEKSNRPKDVLIIQGLLLFL